MKTKKNRSSRGFTLLEVLIAILIAGIIATAALPLLSSYTEKAREAREEANMVVKREAIDRYVADHKVGLGMVYDASDDTVTTYGLETMQGPTAQLLLPTDVNGNVMDDPMTANPGPYSYGPYLAELPPEPASLVLAAGTIRDVNEISRKVLYVTAEPWVDVNGNKSTDIYVLARRVHPEREFGSSSYGPRNAMSFGADFHKLSTTDPERIKALLSDGIESPKVLSYFGERIEQGLTVMPGTPIKVVEILRAHQKHLKDAIEDNEKLDIATRAQAYALEAAGARRALRAPGVLTRVIGTGIEIDRVNGEVALAAKKVNASKGVKELDAVFLSYKNLKTAREVENRLKASPAFAQIAKDEGGAAVREFVMRMREIRGDRNVGPYTVDEVRRLEAEMDSAVESVRPGGNIILDERSNRVADYAEKAGAFVTNPRGHFSNIVAHLELPTSRLVSLYDEGERKFTLGQSIGDIPASMDTELQQNFQAKYGKSIDGVIADTDETEKLLQVRRATRDKESPRLRIDMLFMPAGLRNAPYIPYQTQAALGHAATGQWRGHFHRGGFWILSARELTAAVAEATVAN